MSDNSRIEWTDATWNPVRGCCTKISPGCTLECNLAELQHALRLTEDASEHNFPDGRRISFVLERRLAREVLHGTLGAVRGCGFRPRGPRGPEVGSSVACEGRDLLLSELHGRFGAQVRKGRIPEEAGRDSGVRCIRHNGIPSRSLLVD
jgi:hypothetical protein